MAVIEAGPPIQPRKETVAVPEWGGDVIVRGLMASEVFALTAIRQQATRRVREEVQAARDAQQPMPEVEMTFEEWRRFAAYTAPLLSMAVRGASGEPLYTAEQWECMPQHYPGVAERLQAVAERLSGLNAEDVEKNSPTSQG